MTREITRDFNERDISVEEMKKILKTALWLPKHRITK
jgi:hypothetical protein